MHKNIEENIKKDILFYLKRLKNLDYNNLTRKEKKNFCKIHQYKIFNILDEFY